jgi:hypothetical protein
MITKFLGRKGTWREVADAANETIGKDAGTKEPSSSWKKRMLLCEHSPIRLLSFKVRWQGIKYWVSQHLCRHWVGIVHFVKTQRTDRTGIDRNKEPQDAPVNYTFDGTAQSLINVSRRRLCFQASPETRDAWIEFLEDMRDEEPEMFSACVPDCVYRGYCYEYKCCGWFRSADYTLALEKYREVLTGR